MLLRGNLKVFSSLSTVSRRGPKRGMVFAILDLAYTEVDVT